MRCTSGEDGVGCGGGAASLTAVLYLEWVVCLAHAGLPLHTDPRLRETNLGVFEGYSWEEVHTVFPELLDEYHASECVLS